MKYEYKGVELELTDDVYKPSEDSELLADVISGKIEPGMRVLDMGCGSGFLTILAAKAGAKVIAVDINPSALRLTEMNARTNGVKVETVLSNVFEKADGRFDMIIFNPPYLPDNDDIEGSEMWSKKDVIERFVAGADRHLKLEGEIYMLVSSLTPADDVVKLLKMTGFKAEIVESRKVPWETLSVIHARR